jgi:hypothetical protein
MTDIDEHLIERIRTSAGVSGIAPPSPSEVIAAGRRRRRKDRLLASGVAVVVALGVVLPLRALVAVGDDESEVGVDRSDSLPRSCLGYRVDIYAIADDTIYEGTPGDDVVIQGVRSTFRPNGGLDIVCMIDGSPGGVSVDGHRELMGIDDPKELEEAVRRAIDAEPYPVPGRLTPAEVLTVSPFDPKEAVRIGWPAAHEELETRAVAWYHEQQVAEAPIADLERAIFLLRNAIGDPPILGEPPAELLYTYEMTFRREVVCRSLPAGALRDDFCSRSSVPSLSEHDVPWTEPPTD